jgi:soluble lytic murein transglycosylase-like protein
MISQQKFCLLFASYCLALCFPTIALADIYQLPSETEEIVLTNLVPDTYAEVLIVENTPIVENTAPQPIIEPSTIATQALPFAEEVQLAAKISSIEPELLHAVIATESRHNPKALSPKGAQGLMQLMPATAKRFGVENAFDPRQNILAGASYLSELREQFNGNIELTLAAYNAGPGAVIRYGSRIPPFAETRRYVPAVLKFYRAVGGKLLGKLTAH